MHYSVINNSTNSHVVVSYGNAGMAFKFVVVIADSCIILLRLIVLHDRIMLFSSNADTGLWFFIAWNR